MRSASPAMLPWPPGPMEAKRLTGDAPLATRLSGGEPPHKRRSTGHQAWWRRSATLATLHWPPSSVDAKCLPGDAPLATRLGGGEAPHWRLFTGHRAQWMRSASPAMLHWPTGSMEAKCLTGDAPCGRLCSCWWSLDLCHRAGGVKKQERANSDTAV